MGFITRITTIINQYYLLLLSFAVPIILYYNWATISTQKPHWHDLNFVTIFNAGFDTTVIQTISTPTFPMWGYSWLLYISHNHLFFIILQITLMFFALSYFTKTITKTQLLSSRGLTIFKLLLVSSFYFLCITIRHDPKPLGIALLIIAISVLLKALYYKSFKYTFLAGIIFGLMLNFRSDYWLFPLGLLLLLVFKPKKQIFIQLLIFIFASYSMLIPWALYTKKATGHYLLTSTNSGHVCLIGLGLLQPNPWNITPSDGDPHMQEILEKEFGRQANSPYFSCTYHANRLLQKKWFEYIWLHPWFYLKKTVFSFYLLFRGTIQREGLWGTSENFLQKTIGIFTFFHALLMLLIGYCSALFYSLSSKKQSELLLVLVAPVWYQTLFTVVCFQAGIYTHTIFVFLLFFVALLSEKLWNTKLLHT